MTLAALVLVLAAAFLHAGWNLLAKRAGGGALFVCLFTACTSVIYAPLALALVLIQSPAIGPAGWLCIGATGCVHLGYFLSLQRGYRFGDLSLVYPLARGTGPMLATVAAIVLLGERPSSLALIGAGLIVVSVFIFSGGMRGLRGQRPPLAALGYGLLTGALIATYTVLDKYAVSALLLPPLLYVWLGDLVRTLLVAPYALRHRDALRREWLANRRTIVAIAVMSPLAYILVLTAMVFTPLSYIAAAREVSILIGAVLGAHVLSETLTSSRLLAAIGMVLGLAALAIG